MIYAFAATHIQGGDEGALDAIDGSKLEEYHICTVIGWEGVYFYQCRESGKTEVYPNIIEPVTNPGNKRWHLINYLENEVGSTTTTT